MKRNLFIVALFIIVLSCVRENDSIVPESSDAKICLSAKMENEPASETKSILSDLIGGLYFPLWEDNDSLAVFTKEGQKPTPFTLIDGAGQTQALFEGPLKGERYVALSPYMSEASYEGNTLSFEIPHIQRYRPGSYSADGFAMIAVSESGELHFKNLCSVLRLSLTGSCMVNTITLSSASGLLSGPASVNVNYSEEPTLTVNAEGRNEVKLDCFGVPLDAEIPTFFHIVVPAGTFDGLTITINTYTETVAKTVSQALVIKRSEWRPVAPFVVDAPQIDLDNLPDNHIWYKTKSGELINFDHMIDRITPKPFDVGVVAHQKVDDYGVLILDGPVRTINGGALLPVDKELHLPDCVETIDWYAISAGLDVLRIPGQLVTLRTGNLDGHKRIYGPLVADDGRSIVRDKTLMNVLDTDLEEYVTPPGIECLGTMSIQNKGFKRIIISDGVRELIQAIDLCPNLESIVFPESMIRIEFSGENPNLTGFFGSSRCVSSDHKLLISPSQKRLVAAVRDDNAETCIIPEGVQSVLCNFRHWPHLKKLILPSSLQWFFNQIATTSPGLELFEGPNVSSDGRCLIIDGILYSFVSSGIKEYTFPGEASIVYPLSLSRNHELESVRFSEGTAVMGTGALGSCENLKTVVFPTTIRSIANGVFDGDYNLESIFLPVRVPPYVSSGSENYPILGEHPDQFTKLTIYVPEESLEDYLTDPLWYECRPFLQGYHFDNIDAEIYESSDYSADGIVSVLQEATEGNGIDIVLMGDAFSDRQIKDGTYMRIMEECMDALFEEEPYHSFRPMFNVYVVNAVSAQEEVNTDNTAFKVWVNPVSVEIGGDVEKCREYALKAIPDSRLDEATILVVANVNLYEGNFGVCMMSTRSSTRESDFGSGVSVSFISKRGRPQLVNHEVGGHGFAKLGDEYWSRGYDDNPIPEDVKDYNEQMFQKYGWEKNLDYTSDASLVRWNRFLSDSRYEKELLGVFEGGGGYWKYGVYRPSYNSIMNNNYGGYNAPSREAIYYRIHKLAYGTEWEYDYEEFVRWDQGSKTIHPTSVKVMAANRSYEEREPLPFPKNYDNNWTDIIMK